MQGIPRSMFESSFFVSDNYYIDMSRIESIEIKNDFATITMYSKNTILINSKSNEYQDFIKTYNKYKRI